LKSGGGWAAGRGVAFGNDVDSHLTFGPEQSNMLVSAPRIFLCVLLLGSLLALSEAFTTAALVGGGATAFLYMTGVVLGPVGLGAVFLGSTLGTQYLGTKMDEEKALQRVADTRLDRLQWTNCSRPATFSTRRSCRSKHHCDDYVQMQGSHDCNTCGAEALAARRWLNPLDTSDYRTEVVCMDARRREIVDMPITTTPVDFWNCSALPHFHECRRCGSETAFARYGSHLTAAGLQLVCIRTDGTTEQRFV
jgi:hypothetical protein